MSLWLFRIQDADGRGPWKPGFSKEWTELRPEADYQRLVPFHKEFPNIQFTRGMNAGCGCESLAQLRLWFTPGEYKKLCSMGYQCVQLEVDKILGKSSIQCVFERTLPLNQNIQPVTLYKEKQTA